MVLTLILLVSLSISTAFANDNVTNDNLTNLNQNSNNINIQSTNTLSENSNTSSSIYVSTNGSDTTGDGGINNPYNSISYAVNKSTSGSTIYLSSWEYSGSNNSCIYINKKLTISAQNSNTSTIINGAGFDDSIFTVNKTGKLTLTGLTLINGKSDEGGAIKSYSGSVINIDNCTFMNNQASRGGFMYNLGTLTLTNSYIINNTAEELGGGIKNWGVASLSGDVFIGNLAKYSGGAIYNFYFPITINNCSFYNNSAYYVGGSLHNVGTLILTNSLINGSKSLRSDGGAICNDIYGDDTGNCCITNTVIVNSTALKNGGAIFNNEVQRLNLTNSSIISCSAKNGGAIYNIADLLLVNNTMKDCSANNDGDYIYNLGNIGTSVLTFNANPNKTKIGKDVNLTVKVTDDNGNTITGENLTFTINGDELDTRNITEGIAKINYSTKSLGEYTISGVYSGSNSTNFKSLTNNGVLNVVNDTLISTELFSSDLTLYYGSKTNYTVSLTTSDGFDLVGEKICLNLTRLSNGLSKVYWVTTDTNGLANLEINLGVGEYSVYAFYPGKSNYTNSSITTSLNVLSFGLNSTFLSVNLFNRTVGAGDNFTGVLTDNNGNVIVGQHIALNLTRLSNGLSKVYWVTTDTNGEFQLAINLGVGNYSALCNYYGNSKYASSSNFTSIIVNNPLPMFSVLGASKDLVINSSDSIQDAINNAIEGSTIFLSSGVYNQSGIVVNKSLSFVGLDNVTINANRNGSCFIIYDNYEVLFSNLTFINGFNDYGGAIDNFKGIITICDCIFINNSAENNGGAVANLGTVNIDCCIFVNNSVENNGGAVNTYTGRNTILNSIFVNNTAKNDGGAVANGNLSKSYIGGCYFLNNYAHAWGGAVYSWLTNVTVSDNSFYNNSAGDSGGALITYGVSKIFNNSFVNNYARMGGAISVDEVYSFFLTGVTCNYNYFVNNSDSYRGTDVNIVKASLSSNFDDNWWGVNNPLNSTVYPISFSSRCWDPGNYIANITSWLNMETSVNGSTLTVNMVSSSGNNKTTNIPLFTNVKYGDNSVSDYLTNGTYSFNLNISSPVNVTTVIDYQSITNTVNPVLATNLTGDNYIFIYGVSGNYTVKLTDINGNPIEGKHLSLNLTRLSNGLSKVYWVTTDTDGIGSLPINLGLGNYNVEAVYSGDSGYLASMVNYNIIVVNSFVNTTPTILAAFNFNQSFGAGDNFTGKLVDVYGAPVVGQHIALNLTRLSNGLSKVYWVTTDTNGEFQLAINLGIGDYAANCSFAGTSVFGSSSDTVSIVVY